MTVSTTTNKSASTGNGVTTLFGFPIPFIAASDLQVYVAGVLKTLNTDYTISGSAPYPTGANVTFVAAPANGAAVLIVRTRPYTQTLDLVANDPLPADSVEQLLGDHMIMCIQQLKEITDRAFTLPITDTSGASLSLPSPIANYLLAWNSTATGLVNVTSVTSTSVSAAMAPVLAATTLALARVAMGAAGTADNNTFTGVNLAPTPANGTDTTQLANAAFVQKRTQTPQGRLTLTTGVPVMAADAVAQSTVYYAPYVGDQVPIFDGTNSVLYPFSQLSLALDSNAGHTGYQQLGNLFDLFVFLKGGVVTLGAGPVWSSTTARGTGAGTTQITQNANGIWTNTNSINLKSDATAGAPTAVATGQATYVGTMYATANGQTGMSLGPSVVVGGGNNILGLYNAYNRVRIVSQTSDNTVSWTYAIFTWRAANASNNNRISWVDGLQQSVARSQYNSLGVTSSSAVGAGLGVGFDSTTVPATQTFGFIGTSNQSIPTAIAYTKPFLGFHFAQALEISTAATSTFTGNSTNSQSLWLELDM